METAKYILVELYPRRQDRTVSPASIIAVPFRARSKIENFYEKKRDGLPGDNPSKLLHDWIIILLIELNAIENEP